MKPKNEAKGFWERAPVPFVGVILCGGNREPTAEPPTANAPAPEGAPVHVG